MKLDIQVVAEEKDFFIVNKPAGQSIQSDEELGYAQTLRETLGNPQLFPVHRLDKETTGLLIVAKGSEANSRLSQLFQNRLIDKYYWAISAKKPKKKQGLVVGDMVRARNGAWKLLRSKENPAISQFFSYGLGDGKRLFLVRIYTGKTHQIRVALKSLGSPILGDDRYGGAVGDRFYLHAGALGFTYEGKEYKYVQGPEVGEFFVNMNFQSLYNVVGDPMSHHWPAVALENR